MWVEPHDNNAPILGYYVSYNQPVFAGREMVIVNTIGTMANITELYPAVVYNFTVMAFNEVGNSSSSTAIPFRTLEESKSNTCMNVPPVIYNKIKCSIFSSSFRFSPKCECIC